MSSISIINAELWLRFRSSSFIGPPTHSQVSNFQFLTTDHPWRRKITTCALQSHKVCKKPKHYRESLHFRERPTRPPQCRPTTLHYRFSVLLPRVSQGEGNNAPSTASYSPVFSHSPRECRIDGWRGWRLRGPVRRRSGGGAEVLKFKQILSAISSLPRIHDCALLPVMLRRPF